MPRKLIIDGREVEVDEDLTLIQACEAAGVAVPRFCYHERLSIAGNCRMCLVEVIGTPKPQASCALTIRDLPPNKDGSPRVVNTNTAQVKKAREGVMEFLLINHPLDCPICDQGGECDLQDQAMAFGGGLSRYDENKRAVEEKNLGPLIKTQMTRCIQCTRCVRYMTEVAGVEELGAIGRGEDMEITTYLEKGIMSEMSANVVDLCPVGALTHRPWAFQGRPWELKKTETIDVMDAVGSNIRVDVRGRDVMRILPRNNDAVNEEWISDKTRHVADGLKTQRLDQPYAKRNGHLAPATWDEALAIAASKLKSANPSRVAILAGDLAGAEEMFALKDLAQRLGITAIDCRTDGARLDPRHGRASYVFNSTIAGIEQADAILLIGTNPRHEAAVLNARIRKRYRQGNLLVGVIGPKIDLGYEYSHLGEGPAALATLMDHPPAQKQRPMFIVGPGAYARPDGAAMLGMAAKAAQSIGVIKDGWNGFNVLHTAASRVAGLDLGFVPPDASRLVTDSLSGYDVIYLLGVDEIDASRFGNAFVIYQGSHGDNGAHRADLILPGAAYTEKSVIYVNTEGRAQMTAKAAFPPGTAKDDWAIIRALSSAVGQVLPYDTIEQLRTLMIKDTAVLGRLDQIVPSDAAGVGKLAKQTAPISAEPLRSAVRDFYMTNPIARASVIMAELSMLARGTLANQTGSSGDTPRQAAE